MKLFSALGLSVLMLGMSGQGLAETAKKSSSIELAYAAQALKPGEWVWAPEIAPTGPVMIYVDLSRQIATIYRNGVRIGVTTISSGKDGHETPTGVFTILQKDIDHHSNLYDDAPMPFMQRLTWSGVALHAGNLPGYPASHGCIRLPYALAEKLFTITSLGITVIVNEVDSVPMRMTGGDLLLPVDAVGAAPPAGSTLPPSSDYEWHPERAPQGPVTVIISQADNRIIVMWSGVEIGRARISMPARDFESHVLTLTITKSGERQWIFASLPGREDEAGKPLDSAISNEVQIPKPFADALSAILKSGDTVFVTPAVSNLETTGEVLTIMEGDLPTGDQIPPGLRIQK